MTTPNAMPRKKVDAIHTEVLSALLATKPATWVKKTLVPATSISKEDVDKVTVTHLEPKFALARNVSEENIDRAAKRWLR